MSIELVDGFNVNVAKPLDTRFQVADLTDRDDIPSGVRYPGMKTYVESELKYYSLVGGITNSDWVEDAGYAGSTIDPIVAALIFG